MSTDRPVFGTHWASVLVVFLSVASSITVLGNAFAYDDIPVLSENADLQSLSRPWAIFSKPYWPPPYAGLYRPLSSLLFALEWQISGGTPWILHAFSVLVYAATCLGVLLLARRLLPAGPAAVVGALFAVHPIHTESVALVVNQSELLVVIWAVLALCLYLDGRKAGPLSSSRSAALLIIYVLACLTKEHAIVLPALIAVAEMTIVRDQVPLSQRLTALRPLMLASTLVALCFIIVRAAVLDDPVGSFTAEAFRGASAFERALTMLNAVGHWTRLLLWPAALQFDYTPQEIVRATSWGMAQWTGAWLLAAALAATALAWKRRPVTAFAIAWMALALLPVSNVIIPTGVVVAERTLFLASAGFVLLIGDLTAAVSAHRDKVRRPYRIAGAIALVTLLLLGAGKSLSRYPVWKNQLTLFQQSVIDAPKSYKAHWGLANVLVELDALPLAEARFRLAIDLYPDEPRLLQRLADVYRQASLCAPAVPLYRRALEIRPEFWSIRVSLVGCLVHLGQYREARAVATMGVARGENVTNFQHFLVTIDSAAAVSAPPGAVALTAVEPNPALESAVP